MQFTKAGPGTTIITGAQTYTGQTNVGAGILQLGNGIAGNDATLATSGVYIAAGAKLQFNISDTQTWTNTISTDSAGNYLATLEKTGTGTLNLREGQTASKPIAWVFTNGIVNVTDLSGTATSPFGAYSNANGLEMVYNGGALQFTGTGYYSGAATPYSVAANLNRLYHQTALMGNGTIMADGSIGSTPLSVEGSWYVPGPANSRTLTLEAANGAITPGTATSGSYLTNGQGGGVFNATLTDANGISNNSVPVVGSTTLVKTGPGIWQIAQGALGITGGVLVEGGTLLITNTNTSGIYIPNSYCNASVTVAKNAFLDVGGGTTAAAQKLVNNGTLRGEGTIINSATTGTAPGGFGYGAVVWNTASATHYDRISPGPDTTAGYNNMVYGVGTLTTGSETWAGYSAQNRYDWDVTAVSGAGNAQSLIRSDTSAQAADFLNIQGTLDLTGCGAAGGGTEFRIGAYGVSGSALGAVTNWNGHKSYTWTISTATGGFVTPGNIANMQNVTLGAFSNGGTNDTTGGSWSVVISGNNLNLVYTGDGNVTPATATWTATSNVSRLLTGQTATITSTLVNTSVANSAQDTITYSAFGITGGANDTSNSYGLGAGGTDMNTNTWTAGGTGIQTVNPSATSITNSWLGTALSPVTTGASIDVVAMRSFTPR